MHQRQWYINNYNVLLLYDTLLIDNYHVCVVFDICIVVYRPCSYKSLRLYSVSLLLCALSKIYSNNGDNHNGGIIIIIELNYY